MYVFDLDPELSLNFNRVLKFFDSIMCLSDLLT